MKKFFSQDNFKKIYSKCKKFLIKHYKLGFKGTMLTVAFVISGLLNSILLRVICFGKGFKVNVIFADLAILLFIGAFAYLFKHKKRYSYLLVMSFILTIICIIQSAYYAFYSSFASVSLLATSVFIADVGDAVVEQVVHFKDFIYLWQPIFLIYIHTRLKKKEYYERNKKEYRKNSFLNYLIVGLSSFIFFAIFVTPTEWSRFGKLWNRESVVNSFGVYTYQINDIVQSLKPKINNLFGHDKALKEVRDYYESNPISGEKNKYSGIFEGKNVIAIHAESIQSFVMDLSFYGKEVTPNLNKLAKEGLFFSNFYSEVGVGTSSDAEFTFSTSMMPASSGTVFVSYFDREYETIQKLFRNKGYYTFSMHANTADFWNRATMHKNMGYDDFYSKSSYKIDEELGLGLTDKSFFKQSVPKLQEIKANNTNFYGTLITLSNHTPWNNNEYVEEYPTTWTINVEGKEIVRDYINDTTLGNYIESTHYADQALGEFITNLDNAGLLENTVIVIYGDHDARISRKYYNILYNYDPYTDTVKEEGDEGYVDFNKYEYELNRRVPFIIWTKDGKYKENVKTPMGMIDVLPTLGNMFNIHSDYQLGQDVFNIKDGDNVIPFTDGSFLTSKIYYNGQNGEIYPINGAVVDEVYINEKDKKASSIIEVSDNIIIYDLLGELKGKKEEK